MMRTMDEIQKDYSTQCALLGEVTYKLKGLELDRARMIRKLSELQKEAMEASKAAEGAQDDSKG